MEQLWRETRSREDTVATKRKRQKEFELPRELITEECREAKLLSINEQPVKRLWVDSNAQILFQRIRG